MTAVVDEHTDLSAPAEAVWAAVAGSPDAFRFVTRGLLRFPAIEGLTGSIEAGARLSGWLLALGVVPVWRHTIVVAERDDEARRLVTHEHGGVLRVWRHTISVDPLGDGRCRYRDRVEVDAGAFTGVAVPIVTAFYRLRQRRWHTVAAFLATGAGR